MDTSGDGHIQKDEFVKALTRTYNLRDFTIERIENVFRSLDRNKSGDLSIGELLVYIQGAERTMEERVKEIDKEVVNHIDYEIK